MAPGLSCPARLRRNIAWSMVLLLWMAGSPATSSGATPELLLWRATQRGDVPAVRLLLTPAAAAQDIALDGKNDALWSAVSSATRHPAESKQMIRLLLAHGADVNARLKGFGHRPSYLVESPEQLKQLLDIGADVTGDGGDDPPAIGIACNHAAQDPVAMLTLLLAHGAQIPGSPESAYGLLRCAVTTHRPDLEEFLLAHGVSSDARRGTDKTVLFDAPDAATIEPLLRHGADINAAVPIGATALSAAIEEGRVSKSLLLLARGANANTKGPMPALTLAARLGQLPVVSALLAHGADIGAGNGDTALEAAVAKDSVAIAEVLLNHGADVNGSGTSPGRPLHEAAEANSAAMVELLLSHHADITATGSSEVPAYRTATSQEVLAVFARAGAPVARSLGKWPQAKKLLRQAHASQQFLKPGIVPQRILSRFHPQRRQKIRALNARFFQRVQCCVVIANTRVSQRHKHRIQRLRPLPIDHRMPESVTGSRATGYSLRDLHHGSGQRAGQRFVQRHGPHERSDPARTRVSCSVFSQWRRA